MRRKTWELWLLLLYKIYLFSRIQVGHEGIGKYEDLVLVFKQGALTDLCPLEMVTHHKTSGLCPSLEETEAGCCLCACVCLSDGQLPHVPRQWLTPRSESKPAASEDGGDGSRGVRNR